MEAVLPGSGQELVGRTGADRAITATLPVVAMLSVLLAVVASGLSRRSPWPASLEPLIYGWFADRYPLFAFALVYGAVRLVATACAPGPASPPRRAVFGLAGVAALAAAGLYPTFGGPILRAGFATGGMAFLTGQPLWLAYALGTAVAAALFGGIVGGFGWAARGDLRPTRRGLARGTLAYLSLCVGGLVVGFGRDLGPWPQRAFRPEEAAVAACLLAAAAAPHACLVFLIRGRGPIL